MIKSPGSCRVRRFPGDFDLNIILPDKAGRRIYLRPDDGMPGF
ncbi:hypothetical protein CLOSTASPAR_02666 [[Clostridium] asparagiforme DSM 15981]|uniref:Uncharacterized protein n=1 Tax=[Clostridium] asparagiforme DSM 15981 TaxID=518636 RepID=C0D084_9FIRM|nr:hypothetical protein CLOSTASPAR_02666 [[Clostridium] asparagiforme DSM 15981]